MKEHEHRWPEGAIVYHIYPRSFRDANGDGIGDLQGVIEGLPYLTELGVNAIWLSPFYPSPMADFGYDIADYQDVDPMFGTLDDFEQLLEAAHKRKIRVIIDLVPNHTSDRHEWFLESRKSKDNPYADWYIWRDPKPDPNGNGLLLPNNWRDALSGRPAWDWDPLRGQFYLHSFNAHQPDLNWSNPAVRRAMRKVMRFWLDLGVDGFRVDAVYWMAKEPLLSDDDMNPNYVEGEDLLYNAVLHNNSRGWPAVYAYLSEMADTLHEEDYRERQPFMVTEAYPERDNPLGGYLAFYVGMDPKVAAPFNFEGVNLPWRANEWRRFLRAFHTALPQFSPHCVASYAFGNHDQPRLASRLGDAAARSAAVMLLTLPGMAFIYYGEELGMKDVDIPPEMVQDPAALGDPKHGIGRDPQRTPFQWSNEKHAGFSKGKYTWLPVAPDYKHVNIEAEKKDPGSYLSLYRLLCAIRNKTPALQRGHVEIIDVSHPEVVGYLCSYEKDSYLVLINFSGEPVNCQVRNIAARTLIVSSDPQTALTEVKGPEFALAPHEAALFQAEKQ